MRQRPDNSTTFTICWIAAWLSTPTRGSRPRKLYVTRSSRKSLVRLRLPGDNDTKECVQTKRQICIATCGLVSERFGANLDRVYLSYFSIWLLKSVDDFWAYRKVCICTRFSPPSQILFSRFARRTHNRDEHQRRICCLWNGQLRPSHPCDVHVLVQRRLEILAGACVITPIKSITWRRWRGPLRGHAMCSVGINSRAEAEQRSLLRSYSAAANEQDNSGGITVMQTIIINPILFILDRRADACSYHGLESVVRSAVQAGLLLLPLQRMYVRPSAVVLPLRPLSPGSLRQPFGLPAARYGTHPRQQNMGTGRWGWGPVGSGVARRGLRKWLAAG